MLIPMSRRPKDTTPQRRLVDLLRVDIDRAMEGDTRAAGRVSELAASNPSSIHATFVTYNLGIARTTWLDTHVVTPDLRARAGGSFHVDAWLVRSSN